mgnify:CR=1 FL=1
MNIKVGDRVWVQSECRESVVIATAFDEMRI